MFSGLFDLQERVAKIEKQGDPLMALGAAVDWEIFRSDFDLIRQSGLEEALFTRFCQHLQRAGIPRAEGGRILDASIVEARRPHWLLMRRRCRGMAESPRFSAFTAPAGVVP